MTTPSTCRLATFDGMAERTITISSAGKTFNTTGWKIGWACGPAPLIAAVRAAKQFLTYVGGAPFQPAIAGALRDEMAWVGGASQQPAGQAGSALRRSGRGRLRGVPAAGHLLRDDGYSPAGCRTTGCSSASTYRRGRASSRCRTRSSTTTRVDGKPFVRFAFCKRDEVIDEAVRRLGALQ